MASASGKFCYGKTPLQTFKDSKRLAVEKSNEILYLEDTSDGYDLYDTQIATWCTACQIKSQLLQLSKLTIVVTII